jgi:hypothetical protein
VKKKIEMSQFFKKQWMASSVESRLADVKSNLAVLGQLKDHDRLCLVLKPGVTTDDGSASPATHVLNIDQRWVQPVTRWNSGDSRARSMAFVELVLDDVQAIANIAHQSYQNQQHQDGNVKSGNNMFVQSPTQVLDDLKSELAAAVNGIDRFKKTTYANDRQFCIDIDTKLITRINLIILGIKTFFTKPAAQSSTYADKFRADSNLFLD